MNKSLQVKLTSLENCVAIQRDSLARGYMHGMLNGLILAHAIMIDASNVKFAELPKQKSKIRHKLRNQ